MPKAIKLSDQLASDASTHAKAQQHSTPRQTEYWARIGKLAEENPDLPMGFVRDMLIGWEEAKSGDVSEFSFG